MGGFFVIKNFMETLTKTTEYEQTADDIFTSVIEDARKRQDARDKQFGQALAKVIAIIREDNGYPISSIRPLLENLRKTF